MITDRRKFINKITLYRISIFHFLPKKSAILDQYVCVYDGVKYGGNGYEISEFPLSKIKSI